MTLEEVQLNVDEVYEIMVRLEFLLEIRKLTIQSWNNRDNSEYSIDNVEEDVFDKLEEKEILRLIKLKTHQGYV